MPVKDASDVAGGVDLLRLTLEEEGMAQQLVVLGPLALFLFHSEDFSPRMGSSTLTGRLHWCGGETVLLPGQVI